MSISRCSSTVANRRPCRSSPARTRCSKRGEVALRAGRVERDERGVGELGGQHDVRGREPERRERRRHRPERHHDVRGADLRGVAGAVRGARTAEGVDHEVAGIVARLDDGLAQQVAGLRVLHGVDRRRGLFDGEAERLGDLGVDGLAGELDRQRLAPAEQAPLGEDAEHQVGVGVGRLGAAAPVAGGPGHGLRAARADAQVAARVEPGDGAAAGADGLDAQRRHVDRVVVDHRGGGAHRLAVDDEPGEERGAADVGGDDVAVAELATQRDGSDDTAGEDRPDRADRGGGRLVRGHGAAAGLHHEQRTGQLAFAQRGFQRGEVVAQAGADLGAHDRGGVAGELPDPRADLGRQRDEHVGVGLADQLAQPPFVHRVAERPQQRHRDRAHPVGQERADRLARGVLVEGDDHVPVAVDPLGDLQRVPLREQPVLFGLAEHVLQLVRRTAEVAALDVHDEDRVAVALGGEEADGGHVARDQRVQRRRGAVGDVVGVGQHLRSVAARAVPRAARARPARRASSPAASRATSPRARCPRRRRGRHR